MKRNRFNFRTKLLLSTIPTMVVIMAVVTIVSLFMASRGLMSQQKKNMAMIVQKTSTELDAWLADRERDASLFSENGVFQAACRGERLEEAQKRLISYHKLSPIYENLFLADANGKIFMDSIGGKSVGIEVGKLPAYSVNVEEARQGKVWVGEMHASPATGRPVSLITAPILDGGKLIGMVGTPIEWFAFSDIFIARSKIGETGYIFMLDKDGLTFAHPDRNQILKTKISGFDWGRKILEEKNGTIEYTWNGIDKIASFSNRNKKGWIVAAAMQKSELMESLGQLARISALCTLGAIALMVFIIWLPTRSAFRIISRTVKGLEESSTQVATASGQVSYSSQHLAEGASEQAAAIEQTSSALEEISSMTKQNALNANEANQLMGQAAQVVERANQSMSGLTTAIGEISRASEETQKIVKTIDEIAFQTNLLALNAAVEAARAGEAGAGFAVVAEEVRALALKASEAAKNTANLIERTVSKVKDGSQLVQKTNGEFEDVFSTVGKSGALVGEIASASDEQARGIEEVNRAVMEMDKVVQRNAASAEESASASEELGAQAEQMKNFVSNLVNLIGGKGNGKSLARQGGNRERGISGKTSVHAYVKPENERRRLEAKADERSKRSLPAKKGAAGREIRPDQVVSIDKDGFDEF